MTSGEVFACTIGRFFKSAKRRDPDHRCDLLVGQRQLQARLLLVSLSIIRTPCIRTPCGKKFGEFLARRLRPVKRPDFVTRVVVFLAELFSDLEAGVRMLSEKAKKILALYEVGLTGIDGLGSQFVGLARDRGAETQNFARFGNFQDQVFPSVA